jgi:hypothetical protein
MPNEVESNPWLRILTATDEEIRSGDLSLPKVTLEEAGRALQMLARLGGLSFKDFYIKGWSSKDDASK